MDSLSKYVELSISEAEKRTNGSLNFREYYTVYLIETKVNDTNKISELAKFSTVWRRYTEFEQLREYLEIKYPYVIIPPLPEKKVLYGWQKIPTDTFDPDFVDRRRAGLENFLLRIALHSLLSWDEKFIEFLQQEKTWKEASKPNGYLQFAGNKFVDFNISIRLKNPSSQFEKLRNYSCTLHKSIHNLLKCRARVVGRQYVIYKLHANYGRIFSEWSVNEKEMGDGLQKTGHYLDSFAYSIDASLEDEELLADRFKEYLFFALTLENVCRNQEFMQLQLESAEENVLAKTREKYKAEQGKTGLMSRLFGAVDTDEVRELKVNLIDQQIREGLISLNLSKDRLSNFSKMALDDSEKFRRRKMKDLNAILTTYVILQLKTAKKGLQTWINMKDCLQSIP